MNPIELEVGILLSELRDRFTKLYPEEMGLVAWDVKCGGELVEVDVERFGEALKEIFKNAFQFQEKGQPIAFSSRCEDSHLVLEVREGRSAPLTSHGWGAPLVTTRRGGYGLGLFHARRVLDAHKGRLKAGYEAAEEALVTRVTLPLKD